MCSLVMNLCSRDVITIHLNGSRLTGLTCSKAPGFWMVEHQLVLSRVYSVNYRLSPTFHSNAISLRTIILQTSGFHQSIAHSFVTLETKFHVNDVITASVTCKKLAHVIYQLSATVIYYQPPVHFRISIIGQCLNFVP